MGVTDAIKGAGGTAADAVSSAGAAVLAPVVKKVIRQKLTGGGDDALDFAKEAVGSVTDAVRSGTEEADEVADKAETKDREGKAKSRGRSRGRKKKGGADSAPGGTEEMGEGITAAFDDARRRSAELVKGFSDQSLGDLRSSLEETRGQLDAMREQLPDDPVIDQLLTQLSEAYEQAEQAVEQAVESVDVEEIVGSGQDAGEKASSGGSAKRGEGSSDNGAGSSNGAAPVSEAAEQKAEELGVDLSSISGSGAEGMVTARDVIGAAGQDA